MDARGRLLPVHKSVAVPFVGAFASRLEQLMAGAGKTPAIDDVVTQRELELQRVALRFRAPL